MSQTHPEADFRPPGSPALPPGSERILMLGMDQRRLDEVHYRSQYDGRTACALSVGSEESVDDYEDGIGDPPFFNEDALFVLDQGPLTLLAVADGRFGHEPSHQLLGHICARCDRIPTNPLALLELIRSLPPADPAEYPYSTRYWVPETTLVLADLDRDRNRVFGISYGHSSLVHINVCEGAVLLNKHNRVFLYPEAYLPRDWVHAQEFEYTTTPGALLVAHTDGVDRCNRKGGMSVAPLDMERFFRALRSPLPFTRALNQLACAGPMISSEGKIVPAKKTWHDPIGHGGHDNIAIVCTLC